MGNSDRKETFSAIKNFSYLSMDYVCITPPLSSFVSRKLWRAGRYKRERLGLRREGAELKREVKYIDVESFNNLEVGKRKLRFLFLFLHEKEGKYSLAKLSEEPSIYLLVEIGGACKTSWASFRLLLISSL